jgi:hypothetical protein
LRGKLPRREKRNVSLFEVKALPKPAPQVLAAAIEQLAARFGNRLVTSQAVRAQHAHTTTWLKP